MESTINLTQNHGYKKRLKLGPVIINLLTCLFAIIVFAPFILFILNTFKDKEHIYDTFHIPDFTNLSNYQAVFQATDFLGSFALTLMISVATLTTIVMIASMAGYAISRSKFKMIKWLYILLAAGQIIPAQTSMIPIYRIGVSSGMINTVPFLVIIYVASGSAFATIFFAGFCKTIPEALEEAAYIDGCNRVNTFMKIVFPLLKPATATIVATTVYWYWNDFQGPLIYLNAGNNNTLMMTIFKFMGVNNTTDWGPVYALCMMASIPMIIFYIFTQRILLEGLVVGSVKG